MAGVSSKTGWMLMFVAIELATQAHYQITSDASTVKELAS